MDWEQIGHEVDLVVRNGIDHNMLVDDEGMNIAIAAQNGERNIVAGEGQRIANALIEAEFRPVRLRPTTINLTPWKTHVQA